MKTKLTMIGGLVLIGFLSITSCKKEDSTKDSGNAPTDVRDYYVGTYSVSEKSTKIGGGGGTVESTFDGSVEKVSNSSDNISFKQPVRADKVWNQTSSLYRVESADSITFVVQEVLGKGGTRASNGTITKSYLYGTGSVTYEVNQTWTKK
jgi:hypothetical protein